MGKEQVRAYLDSIGRADLRIMEFAVSSATVELAAAAAGVPPAQIAKTLALHVKEQVVIVVLGGEARLNNKKIKQFFGAKAKMLSAEETLAVTGHAVGGVCPFGLKNPLPIYLDQSLRAFSIMYPAGGESNSAVAVAVEEFAAVTGGVWADLSG
ncbi:MAG: YbaK/EbsC family protein [Clostridiales bacterium]|nr:YbaK/EbsC family protein [Clostridiales bacterium]